MITIDIDPVAFAIGSLQVRWYGIMIALAVLTLILWGMREVRKGANLTTDTILSAALVGIPSGLIFSRLLHVVDEWQFFMQNPGRIIGAEGLTIYGAVLGAALGIWVYSKFSNFRFSYFSDLIAPGIILAQAIGRVGCILNGCCYGMPTALPWGLAYTNPNSLAPLNVPFHPVPAYEIIFDLALFGMLLVLKGRLKPEGSLFLVYLGSYSAWRIAIDFLRETRPVLFGLHQSQLIGIAVLVVTMTLLVLRVRQARQPLESPHIST